MEFLASPSPTLAVLLAPLQAVVSFFAPWSRTPGVVPASERVQARAPEPATPPQARACLRVVRVLESGSAPHHAGRMLISGRMADVCAELDRLARHEAEAALRARPH